MQFSADAFNLLNHTDHYWRERHPLHSTSAPAPPTGHLKCNASSAPAGSPCRVASRPSTELGSRRLRTQFRAPTTASTAHAKCSSPRSSSSKQSDTVHHNSGGSGTRSRFCLLRNRCSFLKTSTGAFHAVNDLPKDIFANALWHALQTKHYRSRGICWRSLPCPADGAPFAAVAAPTKSALQSLHSLVAPGDISGLSEQPTLRCQDSSAKAIWSVSRWSSPRRSSLPPRRLDRSALLCKRTRDGRPHRPRVPRPLPQQNLRYGPLLWRAI